MDDARESFYCPALETVIANGACWDYCFADQGGPIDTAKWLKNWISNSKKFDSLESFHKVCENCEHCQWEATHNNKKSS